MFPRFYAAFVCLVWCSLLPGGQSTEAGRPCTIEDYPAEDGEIFVLEDVSGPCIKYLCDDGDVFPEEYSCERNDGSCHPLNDTYTEGCFTKQCQSSGGYIQYVLVAEGCKSSSTCVPVNGTISVGCSKYKCIKKVDGYSSSYSLDVVESSCSYRNSCVAVGQTVQDGCNKYQCVKTVDNGVTTLSIEFIEGGCVRDGQCKPAGDTYHTGCFNKTCTVKDGTIGYVITGEACSYRNSCVAVGQTIQDGCNKYQCVKTVNNGVTTLSIKFIEGGCVRDGQCKPAGDTYGSGCFNKTCTVKDGTIGYVITGEACLYRNGCISVGSTAEYGCTSYQCSKNVTSTTTTYSVSIQQQRCEDYYHKCQNPGSTFPYAINGVVKPNCTCEIKPESTILYRCY